MRLLSTLWKMASWCIFKPDYDLTKPTEQQTVQPWLQDGREIEFSLGFKGRRPMVLVHAGSVLLYFPFNAFVLFILYL